MATKVGTETRQQYYDDCKAKGLPLPELVAAGPNIQSTDVNTTDVRDVYYDGSKGPWTKAS